jgi:hypothetical protein
MERAGKDIERLISRHLDGALTEDEELELSRELIRNPEARRVMEESRRIDALAGAALDRAVPNREISFDPSTLITDRAPRCRQHYNRGWWLIPGALAAALLAVVVNRATLPDASGPQVVERPDRHPIAAQVVGPQTGGANGVMQQVGATPVPRRQIKRDIAREVYGILGEDGRIYWIEVDRRRTIRRPNAESKYRPAYEEL